MGDNCSNPNETASVNQEWAYGESLTYFAIFILVSGLVANVITLLALTWHGKGFPLMSRSLLRHQAIVDSLVCIMGILMYSQDPMWMTGNEIFDHLLCQVWHGQAIFWSCVLVSIWNLVLIATERWFMICYPFKHRNMRLREMYKWLILMYSICFFFLIPAFFQIRYGYDPESNDTTCEQNQTKRCLAGEYYFENEHFERFMGFYGTFWWLICYAIPVGLFIFLYSKVIISLKKRREDNARMSRGADGYRSGSKVLKAANEQITRTAIIVTLAFFLSLSWDAWYCLFGFNEVIEYKFNSQLQVMGVFLAAFNSCTNPFIYAASMSIFRRSLRKTLQCHSRDFNSEATVQSIVGIASRPFQTKNKSFESSPSMIIHESSPSMIVHVNTNPNVSDVKSEFTS